MHKQLKLFLAMDSFFVLALGMFVPIYAIFVDKIGGDILAAGTAWAIFSIVSGVGILLMGKIENRVDKDKLFIIIGYVLQSLSFLGYYFVETVTQLFMIQLLLGISLVVKTPAYDSFYTKYLEKGKFASQWAAWEATFFIVQGIAALVGAFLVATFGFKFLFLAMFLLSLISLVFSIYLKDKK